MFLYVTIINIMTTEAPKEEARKSGMMSVMFDDWNMNYSSPYKFTVKTSHWRKLQGLMGLGDYGGKFTPSEILSSISSVEDQVASQSLSFTGDMVSLYANVTEVEDAMKILQALKKIAEVAEVAGTSIRAVNVQTL